MFGIFTRLANEVADYCLREILSNHTDRGDLFLNVNYDIQSFHPDFRVEVIYVFKTIISVAVREPHLFDAETLASPANLGRHIAVEYFNAMGHDGFEMTSRGLIERKGKRVQLTNDMAVS